VTRLVTEWVNVTGDISIIARESGEVWFHNPSSKGSVDPFATPMTGVGAIGSTVGLLDGAINLGFAGIGKRLARPDPTIAGYVVALVEEIQQAIGEALPYNQGSVPSDIEQRGARPTA
jgi:hypothetical protein